VGQRFNKDKRIAGQTWYYAFKKRHPEATTIDFLERALGFGKSIILEIFDVLEKMKTRMISYLPQSSLLMDQSFLHSKRQPGKLLHREISQFGT
jgi:hypothetical protein